MDTRGGGIEDVVFCAVDVETSGLYMGSRLVEVGAVRFSARGMVDEFSMQIRRELDFSQDGMNAERLRRNMRDIPFVIVPKVYWKYTGPRLLTMEFVEGVRIDDAEAIRSMGIFPEDIADLGFRAYIQQIFVGHLSVG